MPTTPQQMIDMLDEHLPYEISMMMAMHDQAQGPLDQLTGNVVIESFCIHARNLFEFFIKTSNGGEKNNYAFARAFVPKFVEFKDPNAKSAEERLFRKICAQISHLSFNRVKGNDPNKLRTDHEVPEVKRLSGAEIAEFVRQIPPDHKKHWDVGAQKCGLSRWGF
jgi:hypothetical protein